MAKKFKLPTLKIKKGKLFLFILIPIIIALFIGAYFFVLKDIPSTATIGTTDYPQSTNIYDRNGELLYTFFSSRNQSFVPYNKLPQSLKEATIAIEDRDFYKHGAIDIRGITRAAYSILAKQQVQGGSTITQQLVKATLLTPEQTIARKVKEIILAFLVESVYSKDKILEMYLNQVSYGGTAWGSQAASYMYFDKPASELTLHESAFLAGLPQAPSVYSPFGSHPEEGKRRQLEVLKAMREQEYITAAEEKKAGETPLKFSAIQNKILAPHFVFYIKDLLTQKYGERFVEKGGLNVTTSLDLKVQEDTEASLSSRLANVRNSGASNGAAVVTKPGTGEILAMVGSKNYFGDPEPVGCTPGINCKFEGNVNVAVAKRQPGSSIKPINYATGLAKGYTASTPFVDDRTCFPNPGKPPYCPVNYDGRFHGVQQMRTSLANSYNIPAVKMLKLNGLDAMIATASAMGITTFDSPSRYGLSLTLGGGEVMMTEMAEAFGVFANGGYRIPLNPILKVTDSSGKVIQEYDAPQSPTAGKRVMDPGIAFIISDILRDNGARSAAFGSNSVLRVGNFPVSVKTGTTNDYRDNWTIGYTPSYLTAVWVGNNDNTPMSGIVSGVTGAAPIWHDIMEYLLEGTKPEPMPRPDNVVGRTVCSDTGQAASGGCPTRFEYFIQGKFNSGGKIAKEKVFIDKGTQTLAKEGQTENVEEQEKTIITDPTGARYCVDCAHPEAITPTPAPAP